MINTKNLHRYDHTRSFMEQYEEDQRFIQECASESSTRSSLESQLAMFEIFEEAGFGDRVKGAIIALGKKIMEILQKTKEFIMNIIADFKDRSWRKKTMEQKLREIERIRPGSAAIIRDSIETGDISFASYRDLQEFYKNSDEIIKKIRDSKVNPNSLKGRWLAIKKHITRENVQAVAGVVTAIVAVAGAVLTVRKFAYQREQDAIKNEYTERQLNQKDRELDQRDREYAHKFYMDEQQLAEKARNRNAENAKAATEVLRNLAQAGWENRDEALEFARNTLHAFEDASDINYQDTRYANERLAMLADIYSTEDFVTQRHIIGVKTLENRAEAAVNRAYAQVKRGGI